jgi:hypothetical protein
MTPSILTHKNSGEGYERRLLAFIDILGWSGLVERSKRDLSIMGLLAAATELLQLTQKAIQGKIPGVALDAVAFEQLSIRAAYFSDTLVISAPENVKAAMTLVAFVQTTCLHLLLDMGFYTRGAIVLGDLWHRAGVIYGPAMLDAHRLEREVAVYPRILIAPDALRVVRTIPVGALVRDDLDGLSHINIFQCPDTSPIEVARWVSDARKIIDQNMKDDAGDLKLEAKHRWFLRYLETLSQPPGA